MTERDLSDQPTADSEPATEAPVVAGAGLSFDALDSSTPLSADTERGQADDTDRGPDE